MFSLFTASPLTIKNVHVVKGEARLEFHVAEAEMPERDTIFNKKMKVIVLFAYVCLALAGGKLKNEMADLEDKFATVMNDTSSSLEELQADVDGLITAFNAFKEAQAKKDIDNQWQALHMAAAAACRGSTPQGGKGPWSNSVVPKENGVKCDDQCKREIGGRTVCKAEVSLTGYPGKATSYTQIVGHYYNYECDKGWNADINNNEVAAEEDAIITRKTTYYRFCCCAKP
ncbi:hypothetical protein ACHWQZ_G016056 [Mnemiopsis leidyi]